LSFGKGKERDAPPGFERGKKCEARSFLYSFLRIRLMEREKKEGSRGTILGFPSGKKKEKLPLRLYSGVTRGKKKGNETRRHRRQGKKRKKGAGFLLIIRSPEGEV